MELSEKKMKLLILADLHQEFEPFEAPLHTAADVVILAGDTERNTKGIAWAKEAFAGTPVVYVPGNHEYYGETYQKLRNEMQEAAAGSNVHVLDCGKYEHDGVVFLGATLWTDFNLLGDQSLARMVAQDGMNDFKKIRTLPKYSKFRPFDAIKIHSKEKAWLENELKAATGREIVVVTHHLPSLRSVPTQYRKDPLSAAYASNLDEFVASSGAILWVHGHTHSSCDYMIGETQVLSNPRGYPHESPRTTGFQSALTVEI